MRALSSIAFSIVCSLILAGSALAATPARVIEVRRVEGKDASRVARTHDLAETRGVVDGQGPTREGMSAFGQGGGVLNCQNDNVVSDDPLVPFANDMVGSILATGGGGEFLIDEIRIGVFDFHASYPALLKIDLYEDNLQGEFVLFAEVTIEIPMLPELEGDLFLVDVSKSALGATNDLLVLAYDPAPANADGYVFSASDDSPRCLDGDNVCSVVVPANETGLFIWGLSHGLHAADCSAVPADDILLFDVVIELATRSVPVDAGSWGSMKARFDD